MSNINWKDNIVYLADTEPDTKIRATFEGLPDIKRIKKLSPGCSCTDLDYSLKTKILVATIKVGKIPQHLKSVGEYLLTKFITVIYEDNTKEILIIKAKVKDGTLIQNRR